MILNTSLTVSPSIFSLLARPASFIPTPSACDHRLTFAYVADFVRRLQWRFALSRGDNRPSSRRFGLRRSTAWPPQGMVPPRIRTLTTRLLSASNSILRSAHSCYPRSNLTSDERATLEQLRADPSLVVRPADKGGQWVIMDDRSYRSECLRQLSDSTFYQRLPSPLPPSTADPTSVLLDLQLSGHISKSELRFLLPPPSPKPRRFGVFPKVHKSVWPEPNAPPGRPIVADVESINSAAARLIDHFLQPLVHRQASFLLDSQHLLAILRAFRLSPGTLFATFDVRSLYTSVPIQEGIDRVRRAFQQHPDDRRPDAAILQLLGSSLTNNDFTFEDQHWLQISGVAMGKGYGGSFAGLYLGEWETAALNSSPLRPTLWRRFQDDVLVLWDHGPDALNAFLLHLNSLDQHIQLDVTSNPNSIRFLDLELYRGPDGHIFHRIGFKATDCHRLLPQDSQHAPHVHRGVIYSQILRWATRSSTYEDFRNTCRTVLPSWRMQGITRTLIRSCIRRVLRLTALRPNWSFGFFKCEGPRCRSCPTANPCTVFKDLRTSRVFPILAHFTCNTTHCIYLIHCAHCSIFYVGQTSNSVRTRIGQHLCDISLNRPGSPLASHFNSTCSPDAFKWCVLDRCFSQERRLQKETYWISTLKSLHPLGLNQVSGQAPQKLNLITYPATCTARLNSFIRETCREVNVPVRFSYKTDRNLKSLLK